MPSMRACSELYLFVAFYTVSSRVFGWAGRGGDATGGQKGRADGRRTDGQTQVCDQNWHASAKGLTTRLHLRAGACGPYS